MARFSKPFYGVRAGGIYPEEFRAGDECPPELEAAAMSADALADKEKPAAKKTTKEK